MIGRPVLQSEEPVQSSRLALVDLTGRTLALGLELLGIEHPEQVSLLPPLPCTQGGRSGWGAVCTNPSSRQQRDGIFPHRRVHARQHQTVRKGLAHEHPVKRVPVQWRQRAQPRHADLVQRQ